MMLHMCIITKEQAIEKCMVYQGEFLIKPSIDSGEGRLISFFDSQDLDQKSLISAIDGLKANFIVQEAVKQHAGTGCVESFFIKYDSCCVVLI